MNDTNRLHQPQRHDTVTEELDWSRPLVTIRCIAYNQEQYIRDALEGFVMQETTFPFEAIVHDDASTDATASIIKEYTEKYPHIIKPILQKENQYSKGIKSRMDEDINTAMYPHSKYIALCEGDDYWTKPYKLQKQVEFMEEHPEVTLCFHNAILHFEKGTTDRFVIDRNEDGTPKDYLLVDNMQERFYNFEDNFWSWYHPTASWVIRRDVFSSLEYAKMRTIPTPNEDDKLRYTCAHLGFLYSFAEPMSVYRIQPNGISQNFNGEPMGYITRIFAIKYLKLGEKYNKQFNRVYHPKFTNSSINIIKHRSKQGWIFVKSVLKFSPQKACLFLMCFPFDCIKIFFKKINKFNPCIR